MVSHWHKNYIRDYLVNIFSGAILLFLDEIL